MASSSKPSDRPPGMPVLDAAAPQWMQAYDLDVRKVLEALRRENETLKKRLTDAGIA